MAEGIDPAAYNLAESTADLEDLRLALGIHEWNLVAVSADGQLGLTYMRLHPAGIRSAIIDSGMSPQMDYRPRFGSRPGGGAGVDLLRL